jgi:hypothetical protein
MKKILIILLSLFIFTVSCSQIRESAGVNRKNIDEFRVIENPPLVIPPDFNLLPPEQLFEKNIDNVESDLAKEILFGLNEVDKNNNAELSTMEDILIQSKANLIDNSIRNQINEEFASEKNTNSNTWKNDSEILDSVAESERLRNQLLDDNLDLQEQVPIIKIKNKKKKKFFFF